MIVRTRCLLALTLKKGRLGNGITFTAINGKLRFSPNAQGSILKRKHRSEPPNETCFYLKKALTMI